MNTEELERFMLKDMYIRKLYGGVLPKDYLPLMVGEPKMFIVNCDESTKKGSHWAVVYLVNHSTSEYFDPLGSIPSIDFANYLMLQSNVIKINVKQCQSKSSISCGKFCLYYCYFRARGYSMFKIQNMFHKDLFYNDVLVQEFFNLYDEQQL